MKSKDKKESGKRKGAQKERQDKNLSYVYYYGVLGRCIRRVDLLGASRAVLFLKKKGCKIGRATQRERDLRGIPSLRYPPGKQAK